MWDKVSELDQILAPTSDGYKAFALLQLLGGNRNILSAESGFGTAPRHFITQRGPFQDGETLLDMRWDIRVIQIAVNEKLPNRAAYFDRRWSLVDLLRPSRSFSTSGIQPLIYRKWLPGGKAEHGTDLVTTVGSNMVTSLQGKFVHNGLRVGMLFQITTGADAGTYHVASILNDSILYLDTALAATATGVQYRYLRGGASRDLYCVCEDGPRFDESVEAQFSPAGYKETLRFVAHDPFWYGELQGVAWGLDAAFDDLIFDGEGAWFGTGLAVGTPGMPAGGGRWLFAEDYVSSIVSVKYWGHEPAYPTIQIQGPADNPRIDNLTIGTSVSLDYDVAAGETVMMDIANISIQKGS